VRIGTVELDVPVMLAPMAGFTDSGFRVLCRRCGAGAVMTELVNAAGIVRGSARTLHLLETDGEERPVAAHLYGSDPAVMAQAASIVEGLGRFDFIDINCGCPVRRITARGAGVALMRDPGRIADIVRAVAGATSLPVTIKTRLGLTRNTVNVCEVARAAETAGAAAIAVHARTAEEKHGGPAQWEMLARVKRACSVPVIGNGGVATAGDVAAMLKETGVDAVMIGRAALGNPWIFDETRCLLSGAAYTPHSPDALRALAAEHVRRVVRLKEKEAQTRKVRRPADEAAALYFRAHLLKYIAPFRGRREVRRQLDDIRSCEHIMEVIDELIARNRGERDVSARDAPVHLRLIPVDEDA
jgi:nifR3 family TIM-barrel protein